MNEPTDDELNEFEAELRRLAPAALRPQFERRVAQAIHAESGGRRRAWAGLLWAGFGVCAAVALALLAVERHRRAGSDVAAAAVFKPASAEAVVTAVRDEGDVLLGDGTPAHRVAESVVDTVTWKNPRTQATFTWSVPHEEVRIVPISYN